jgi:hypothetical protein
MVINLEPRTLGWVSVDSGLIWIGDPCYIIHNEEHNHDLGRSWSEFCDTIKNKQHHSFDHNAVGEGLGVVTSTKYGDGFYPVIGFFAEDSNRPSFVAVDFDGTLSPT